MLELREGTEYRTHDLDEMLGAVGRLLRPYDVSGRPGRYDASMRHDRLGNLTFITGDYGPEIDLSVEPLGTFYVVQQPLTGTFRARGVGREEVYPRGAIHVLNTVAPVRMSWSRGCKMAVLRLDRSMVEEHVAALADAPVVAAPVFAEWSSLDDGLRRFFEVLYAESRRVDSPMRQGQAARAAEQTLVALLMSSRGGSPPGRPPAGPRPYYVKRAEEFIEANLTRDIGIVDIVRAAGVSARALYYGFRRTRGVGPHAWLRQRRLERAYADLASAGAETTTVTDVALRLGFLHLGKFSAAYRARFGEPPSRTLRRR